MVPMQMLPLRGHAFMPVHHTRCGPPRTLPRLQVWIAILLTVFTIPVVTFVTEFLSIEVGSYL